MADVLVNHPDVGSVWLANCEIIEGFVIGEAWDDSEVGSGMLPDDYRGQPCTMGFPVSCIRKNPDGLRPHVKNREEL